LVNKYFIKNSGVINASGVDLIDFLNRMSTNDFKLLQKDEFRKTVLTTDKGRIVDLINVLNSEKEINILTSTGFEEKIISHLDKYIIMDDVKLEKSKDEYSHFVISGDNLKNIAKDIFHTEIENNKVYKDDIAGIIFYDNFKIETLNIICKKENEDKVKNLLKDFTEMNCEDYEFFRIKNGLPEGINEFNDQINPMECGLDEFISFKKGCYIGQEVIARLDSQGKRPKQMVIIDSDYEIVTDDKIFDEANKEVGFITSSVNFENKYSALGFIRSVNLDYGKNYNAINKSDSRKIKISKIN